MVWKQWRSQQGEAGWVRGELTPGSRNGLTPIRCIESRDRSRHNIPHWTPWPPHTQQQAGANPSRSQPRQLRSPSPHTIKPTKR